VDETPAVLPDAPPPPDREPRSLLEVGGLITLAGLAFGAIVGVIAVLDADASVAGFGVGFGIAFLIFFTGATIATALACLVRQRMQPVALGAIVASCLAIDLTVLAIWLDIDNEAYAKIAGLAFVWSFFALVVLGLVLAVVNPQGLAFVLYIGAIATSIGSAVVSSWLIVSASNDDVVVTEPTSPIGILPVENDSLLRALGALLVLLAASWFGALAASRIGPQTLKRTFTTSPSSTT
jgi:hypothetical protein